MVERRAPLSPPLGSEAGRAGPGSQGTQRGQDYFRVPRRRLGWDQAERLGVNPVLEQSLGVPQ